jgi:hypothetical protein
MSASHSNCPPLDLAPLSSVAALFFVFYQSLTCGSPLSGPLVCIFGNCAFISPFGIGALSPSHSFPHCFVCSSGCAASSGDARRFQEMR